MDRKIILFSAMSLDSYIAKKDGSLDWLDNLPSDVKSDHGYSDFIKTIDTTIMGNNTYKQILEFEGNDTVIYKGKTNYVVSHTKQGNKNNVSFINSDIVNFVKNLKNKNGDTIWIVGGGQLNTLFFDNDLIDEIQLQVFPTLLNKGIKLSNSKFNEINFKLISSKIFPTGVIDLKYEKIN